VAVLCVFSFGNNEDSYSSFLTKELATVRRKKLLLTARNLRLREGGCQPQPVGMSREKDEY